MINYRLSLVATLCFAATACSDDGESAVVENDDAAVSASAEATDTSTSSPASTSDESTTKREGPWGCYLADHHKCDCSIQSEDDCDGVGLWVEGCSTCTPPTEDTGDTVVDGGPVVDADVPDANPPTGFGCYDPAAHECTCGDTESACAEGSIWTKECGCAEETDASTPPVEVDTSTSDSGATSSAPPLTSDPASSTAADAGNGWGCYAPDSHRCDCETDEEQCSAGDGIWTTECACSALDAGQ